MDEEAKVLAVQQVLLSRVWDFCRRNPGLDFTEVLSDCQPVVLRAVRGFDGRSSSLQTFVWNCVDRHLIARRRSASWRRRMYVREHYRLKADCLDRKNHFDLSVFLLDLSERAATAVKIALGRECRKTELLRVLRKEFQWEWDVIQEVFDEVRRAL